jgi:hypothetical protein
MLKLHFAYVGKPVTCNVVKPFLPTLFEPALEVSIPTPITVHLDSCRQCSEELETIRKLNLNHEQLRQLCSLFAERPTGNNMSVAKKLQDALNNIAERPESEIVTIYQIDESAKTTVGSESDDIYAGFPIKVEVASHEDEVRTGSSTFVVDFGASLKHRISAMNLRPVFRAAVAAAAVILIGTALLLNTPSAKALTIDEIYNAIAKIRNVYVAKFAADEDEPALERWVSRTSGIYMTKTKKELVLWDVGNSVKKTTEMATGVSETIILADDIVIGMEEKLRGSLGLMPFYDISEVPEGAEWVRVSEGELESVAAGTEVYDLIWAEKLSDETDVSKKWRFFVGAATNVPQKTEVYVQLPGEEEYTLETAMTVRYLSDGEMEEAIKGGSL